MTIFHLLYGIIFVIAFMQGMKAGVMGMLVGSVVGVGAVLAAHYGGYVLVVWLPKQLGIYHLTRYREQTEETLVGKEKLLSTIYTSIVIFVDLIWLVLCSLCAFHLTKLLVSGVAS